MKPIKGQCGLCPAGIIKWLQKKHPPRCTYHNQREKAAKRIVKGMLADFKHKKQIKFASKKRNSQLIIYRALKKQWFIQNPYCKVNSPVCTGKNEAPQHSKGRIAEMLNKVEFWIPCCNACNGWIEQHPIEARKMKVAFSRLTK